jgi:hypothetical protein
MRDNDMAIVSPDITPSWILERMFGYKCVRMTYGAGKPALREGESD